MNSLKTRLLAAVGIVALLGGCGHFFSWNVSGIPDALDKENPILTAGAPFGINLSLGGNKRAWREGALETERRFHASLSSGTRGQLVAAYQAEVKRMVESRGGTINGSGTSDTAGELSNLSGFSYDYDWRGNTGIVRVYSFDGTDGAVELISLCYEHRK